MRIKPAPAVRFYAAINLSTKTSDHKLHGHPESEIITNNPKDISSKSSFLLGLRASAADRPTRGLPDGELAHPAVPCRESVPLRTRFPAQEAFSASPGSKSSHEENVEKSKSNKHPCTPMAVHELGGCGMLPLGLPK